MLLLSEERGDTPRRRREALDAAEALGTYLADLESRLDARRYSQMASMLDIGAVGAVALENVIDPARRMPVQVALAALSEGLMVLASRQYVKAYEGELRPLALRHAWAVRETLYRLVRANRQDLDPSAALSSIDAVLAPIVSDETPGLVRHVLLLRLMQLLVALLAAQQLGDGARTA
jgi:hypothetical protein